MRSFRLIWHVRDGKGMTQHSEVIESVTLSVSKFLELCSKGDVHGLVLSEEPWELPL